jgi:hypothetical protein
MVWPKVAELGTPNEEMNVAPSQPVIVSIETAASAEVAVRVRKAVERKATLRAFERLTQ